MLIKEITEGLQIQENFIKRIAEWVKTKISSLFRALGFGEEKTISIPIPSIVNEVKVSSVGYYHEWLILQNLRDKLTAARTPYIVTFPQANEIDDRVEAARVKYAEELPRKQPKDKDKFLSAVDRSNKSAPYLADKIIQDIDSSEDIIFIEEIIVTHVGGAGLGKGADNAGGKADIQITARKKNEVQVSQMINASIKIAVGGWITLLTTGTTGIVNKLFFPDQQWGKGDAGWKNLHDNILSIPAIKTQYDQFLANEAKRASLSKMKAQAKKAGDEEEKKRVEKEMIGHINVIGDFVFDILFNQFYPRNKEQINKNFLIALGLDSADDVYYTLVKEKTANTPEEHFYMSSRTSQAYKELYGNLEGDFTIKFERAGRADSATRSITLTDSNGNVFWKSPIQFQQTGRGAWKLFMQDFQEVAQKYEVGKKY